MSDELIQFDSKNLQITQLGLKIDGDPTWQEFWDVGKKLLTVHDGMQLCIGDWVNYGETRWGEKYREALEKTPYGYFTLAHFAWVCKRFPLDIREQICPRGQKTRLGYTHFRVLAPLRDDQVIYVLELMGDRKWSTRDLENTIALKFPKPARSDRFEQVDTEDDALWKRIRSSKIFGKPGGHGFIGYVAVYESDLKRPHMILKRLEAPKEK